jgi:HSP20 family protein
MIMAEAAKKTDIAQVRPAAPATPGRYRDPFSEFDRMVENFFPRGWLRPFRAEWPALPAFEAMLPRVDVIDREDHVAVRAELPGVKKEDLDISITADAVTIKGGTRREEKEERGDYYCCEISRGAFARTIALPCSVNTDKAKASFTDGILELTLPKAEEAKRRVIKVE